MDGLTRDGLIGRISISEVKPALSYSTGRSKKIKYFYCTKGRYVKRKYSWACDMGVSIIFYDG